MTEAVILFTEAVILFTEAVILFVLFFDHQVRV